MTEKFKTHSGQEGPSHFLSHALKRATSPKLGDINLTLRGKHGPLSDRWGRAATTTVTPPCENLTNSCLNIQSPVPKC